DSLGFDVEGPGDFIEAIAGVAELVGKQKLPPIVLRKLAASSQTVAELRKLLDDLRVPSPVSTHALIGLRDFLRDYKAAVAKNPSQNESDILRAMQKIRAKRLGSQGATSSPVPKVLSEEFWNRLGRSYQDRPEFERRLSDFSSSMRA